MDVKSGIICAGFVYGGREYIGCPVAFGLTRRIELHMHICIYVDRSSPSIRYPEEVGVGMEFNICFPIAAWAMAVK